MSKKSILCIATSRNRAEQILTNLRTAHFPSKDLSVVFPDRSILGESGAEKDTQTGQWSVISATERGVEEVALAWPSGLGSLNLAGVGRFTVVGPLLAALGGVTNGATNGGMAASLIRLGVPLFEAQQYQSRIKNGNILLAVHLEDLGDVARAKGILSESYGENICIVDLVPAMSDLSAQPIPLQG
jgi:hypothetical protein